MSQLVGIDPEETVTLKPPVRKVSHTLGNKEGLGGFPGFFLVVLSWNDSLVVECAF